MCFFFLVTPCGCSALHGVNPNYIYIKKTRKTRYTLVSYTYHWPKATCMWKFTQHHFIASKLNAGCSRYLDKIYKILVNILDLKADFHLANFFIWSNFFCSIIVRLQNSNFYVKHWKMKNEKFLLDIHTKYGNIANELLNVAIDAELIFKCKWSKAKSWRTKNMYLKYLYLHIYNFVINLDLQQ